MLDRFPSRRFVVGVLYSFLGFVSSLSAQSLPPVTQPDNSAPESQVTASVEKPLQTPAPNKDEFFSKGFARQLLFDQKTIWISPSSIQACAANSTVPLA